MKQSPNTVAKKLIKINPGLHVRESLYSNCAVIAGWLQSMRKKRYYLFKRVIFLTILHNMGGGGWGGGGNSRCLV